MWIILSRLKKNKKGGGIAPVLTLGFILFNIFVVLIINSFANDSFSGTTIGTSNNLEELANRANESSRSTIFTWSDLNFIRQAGFVINELPWWATLFIGTFQALFLLVTIMAWLRGL